MPTKILNLILVCSAVFSLLSAVFFYEKWSIEKSENREEFALTQEIEQIAIKKVSKELSVQAEQKRDENTLNIEKDKVISVDFSKLKKINEDIIAYFYWPEFAISEVIVQGQDNEFYLNHNVKKNKNVHGTVFLDNRNSKQFDDSVSFLFGHNSYNGSKFAKLNHITEQNYSSTFQIHLEGGIQYYELVHITTIHEQTELYSDKLFDSGNHLYLDRLLDDLKITRKDADNFVFLITCQSADSSPFRKLLIGKKLDS